MPVGQGWSVWLDDAAKSDATATMTGALQSTDLSVDLTLGTNGGWNLIGNPFASAIDRDLGTWGTNTTGAVYVWDNDYDADGEYLTLGSGLTDNVIPISQGFFVKATSAGSSTIPAAAQLHSAQVFYKNGTERPFVNLALTTGGYKTEVSVGFPEEGTSAFDNNLDADRLYGSYESPQMIVPEGDRELCVNACEPLLAGDERIVPLHVKYFIDGDYELTISDLQQLSDVHIELEDLHTGKMHDFIEDNVYVFTAQASGDEGRFVLHFKASSLGVGDINANASKNISIYTYGKTINIHSMGQAIDQSGMVKVYDLFGRLIVEQQINKGELQSVPIDVSNTYLVVKVVKDNEVKTEKVFIK